MLMTGDVHLNGLTDVRTEPNKNTAREILIVRTRNSRLFENENIRHDDVH